MMSKLKLWCSGLALCLMTGGPVYAQSAQQEGVVNTTQILDTGILFAIGAREAEQAIRGAFGWPTFQEGFVDKVYFRFDPDGYARFSNSPRLDEDVFEVICAESSTACLAKKNGIEIGLTPGGQIQIKLLGITPQDSFFVSDNNTELPLPPTILEPLDARLEALLATGGELLIKREQETVNSISLMGFSAVITYLRWVAQNQDSRVFPRGWPVPAQEALARAGGLTQPGQWQSPTPQPQVANTTFAQQAASPAFDQHSQASAAFGSTQGLQTSLSSLSTQQNVSALGQAAFGSAAGHALNQVDPPSGLQQLQSTIQNLQAEIEALRNGPTQRASQDWNSSGLVNQSSEPNYERETPVQTGNFGGQTPSLVQHNQSNHTSVPTVHHTSGQGSELLMILNRIVEIETKIIEMERDMTNAIRDLQFQARHLSSNSNSLKFEDQKGSDHSSEDMVSNLDGMSSLEKILLNRLGDAETLTPEQVSKLTVSPIEATAPSQEDLIRGLLEQLSNAEGGVTPASVESEEPKNEQSTEMESPNSAQAEEGFVTLSDYINNILKSEGKQ